jgi:cell division protease FtsH
MRNEGVLRGRPDIRRYSLGNARNIAFWVVLFVLILALFNLFSGSGGTMQSNERSFSDFVTSVEAGQVSRFAFPRPMVRSM